MIVVVFQLVNATFGKEEKEMQNWVKGGVVNGSLDLLLKFWDPLHILGTVGDRNFKFGRQERNANLGKGVVIGSRDLLLKFGVPVFGYKFT